MQTPQSFRIGHAAARLLWPILAVGVINMAHADEVDDFVASRMSRQHVPGVSIAVVKNGKTVKAKGYGIANLEQGARVTPETVFQIGSVSKQFIAAGVVLLSKDGRVGLDDPVATYLEDAPEAWRAITVRQLLTHTSGLVREIQDFQISARSDVETIRAAYAIPLTFKPGSNFLYSNIGYSVLAEIITRASQKPWPQFIHERIFAPLGMNATRTTTTEELVPHRAMGYNWKDNGFQNELNIAGVRPSGAFISTVLDLAKWDAALYSDVLFSAQERQLLWTPVTLNDGSAKPYGFGWEVGKVGQHRLVNHGGTMYGFRSQLSRYVDDQLTVIVLTNSTQAPSEKFAGGVAALYIPGLLPKRHATKMSIAALDGFTGKFQSPTSVFTVSRRENQLAITAALGPRSVEMALLTPEAKTSFFDEDNPRPTFFFETDAQGRMNIVLRTEEGKEAMRGVKMDPGN